MIPLMRNAFSFEDKTKKELSEFILSAKQLSMGDQCLAFEKEFSKFQDCEESILFNSGGSANLSLLQAYKNLGVLKNNSKVGFSSLTWSTNVMPIIQLGMIPIAIDCEPNTLNIMSKNLLDTLENIKLDALFITNVLGFTGDLDKIKIICDEKNILLIEDNCEALGSKLGNVRTGNFGRAATFSFFVAHHMSTIEGGMIATSDKELAEMLRIVRANGWDRNLKSKQQSELRKKNNILGEFEAKYTFYDLGYNLRPTEITATLGLIQLQYLEQNIIIRNNNHLELVKGLKENPDLINVDFHHLDFLSPFAFPVVCKTKKLRDYYFQQFSGAGIEIRPMIAGNIQNQPFYKKYSKIETKCPGADFLEKNSFYCGNYPELTSFDLETIKSCLIK
tara:strand:- start:45453 stop:46625 length:1173 start_codon:yes stop_codon:yes gene_type:complete